MGSQTPSSLIYKVVLQCVAKQSNNINISFINDHFIKLGHNKRRKTNKTTKQIEMLCTKDRWASKKPRIDEPVHVLYKKLCNSIKVLKIDAASDEILAGSMMRGRRRLDADELDQAKILTPNVMLTARDATHALRRT